MTRVKVDLDLAKAFQVYLEHNLRKRLQPEQKSLEHFFGALDIALSERLVTLKSIGMSKDEMMFYKKKLIENKIRKTGKPITRR